MAYIIDLVKRVAYVTGALATLFVTLMFITMLYEFLIDKGLEYDSLIPHCILILIFLAGSYFSVNVLLNKGQIPTKWERRK